MDRVLSSGPIVWFGIIVTTCLLLVVFQTVLWLVVPILLAIVSYYVLSPLVNMAMARNLTRSNSVLIVTAMLCVFLVAIVAIVFSKIPITSQGWQKEMKTSIGSYADDGITLLSNARNTLSAYSPLPHPPAPQPTTVGIGVVGGDNATALPVSQNDAFRQSISDMIDRSSGDLALELAHWIPSMLLVPVLTYFFLLDGPRFKRFLVQAIPNAYFEKGLYLFYRVEDQIRRYFQGVLTLTVIDATCLGVGLAILGIPGRFSWRRSRPCWRGCPMWAPWWVACWSCSWRRITRRIFRCTDRSILTCPTRPWRFSSACGCSMTSSSCR